MKAKRFIALLLVLILAFSVLTACTAEESKPKENRSDGSGGDENTVDYGGEDFYFRGGVDGAIFAKPLHDYTEEELAEGDASGTQSIITEALSDRLLEVEKKYNCQLHGSNIDGVIDNVVDLAAKLASGELLCDIMYSDSTTLRDLYEGGFIADLSTIKAIDLTDEEKWGGATIQKLGQWKGVQYGIPYVGSRYMPFLTYFYGIMLQKDSAFEAYQTDWTVWELVDGNDWTWDTFLDILPEVGTDDKWDPHYAFAVNATSLINAALSVNEAPIVRWDSEQEKYVFGYTNEQTEEAIEFVRDLYDMKIVCKSTNSIVAFNNDSYTFVLSNAYRVYGDYRNIVTSGSYSWIPFPYGPHSVYGESTPTYCRSNCETLTSVFLGTANDADKEEETQRNGVIYNALMDELKIGDYANYEEYALHNLWEKTDERGWTVYKQYAASVHSPYYDEIGSGLYNTVTARLNACCDDDKISVSEYLGAVETSINNRLDEIMNDK